MTKPCIAGSVNTIDDVVRTVDPQSILLFTGGSSYHRSGADQAISEATSGRSTVVVSDVQANPELADVDAAIGVYRDLEPELVIAVGGGSVIDLAKVVRSVAPHAVTARPYALGERTLAAPAAPLLAIPTTAGTGSEATHFAVIYVDGTKYSIADPTMRPEHVILDPELTYSVPPAVTAATGLDALCQGIESLWSVKSTQASRGFAERAIELALEHLDGAVTDPDPTNRAAMCAAAHLAGRAIDESFTTAPHALSYVLTSRYGIPHGHAVALTLGAVLEYNAAVTPETCIDPRGSEYVADTMGRIIALLGATGPTGARRVFEDLVARVGLDPTLDVTGVPRDEVRLYLLDGVNVQRLANNPRGITTDSLAGLLDRV